MKLAKNARVDLLRSVWLFASCSGRELNQVATLAEVREVEAGTRLTREGDAHREFIVIVEGKAEVDKHGQLLSTLGPGDFVGEMSLLDRKQRVATVTAIEPSTVLVMTAASFELLMRDQPTFVRNLLTVVSRRLRDVQTRLVTPTLGRSAD
jgi:CRP-like cAMP-binding protein